MIHMASQNLNFLRRSTASIVIAVAVVGACVYWLLAGSIDAWQTKKARLHALLDLDSKIIEIASVEARLHDLQNRAQEIEQRTKTSADAAILYDELLRIGRTTGVTVGRINPGTDNSVEEFVRVTTFQVNLTGSFHSIIEFIQMIGEINANTRIRTVDIAPFETTDLPNAVVADIQIYFFQFELPNMSFAVKTENQRGERR